MAFGVREAYRVVDDYLQEGRKAAESFAAVGLGFGDGGWGSQGQRLAGRTLRSLGGVTAQWFELLASVFESFEASRVATSPRHEPSRGGPDGAEAEVRDVVGKLAVSVAVVTSSAHPVGVKVQLDLRPQATGRPLTVPPLRGLELESAPLPPVELSDQGGTLTVRVEVPDGQAEDLYSGVVFDRESNAALGTLCVLVTDPEKRQAS